MYTRIRSTAWPLWALLGLLVVAHGAHAQFGTGLEAPWTDFHDPAGRFSLRVPPGWSYQPDVSDDAFFVWYGTGDYDLFYLEVLAPVASATTPAAQAQQAVARYSGPNGLDGFRLISGPGAGSLSGREASFIVYAYRDQAGTPLTEGRAFVLYEDRVVTLAFAEASSQFEGKVPQFNGILESLQLHERAGAGPGLGMGPAFGTTAAAAPAAPPQASSQTAAPAAPAPQPVPETAMEPGSYTSPGGFYRLTVPAGWQLWEEQSTRRGEAIEPWHGLFPWPGRPMTKTLFVWDYFDEWEQTGSQVDILLGVIENVPGSLTDALQAMTERVAGPNHLLYTVETSRIRIGTSAGVAARIVVRPGRVEPWSQGDPWFKDVTFYALKHGTTFFVWVVPDEVVHAPEVQEALASFRWTGQ